MPYSHKLDELMIMAQSINDSVRRNNDLSDARIASLWHNPSHLGKVLNHLGPANDLKTECRCSFGIVLRDETNQVAQIIASQRRPNQLVSHEANCFLTSS